MIRQTLSKVYEQFLRNVYAPVCIKSETEKSILENSTVISRRTPDEHIIDLTNISPPLKEGVRSELATQASPEETESTYRYQPPDHFVSYEDDVDIIETTWGGDISSHVLWIGKDGVVGPLILSGTAGSVRDLKYLVDVFVREYGLTGFTNYILSKRLLNDGPESYAAVIETGIPLVTRQQDNYGHWMMETLPRVRRAEEYENKTGEWPTLIVPSEMAQYQKRSLELLGYSADKWHQADAYPIKVNRMVMSDIKNVNTYDYAPSPADSRWIADRMKSNIDMEKGDYSQKIFISRQQEARRHILNFDEVEKLLSEYGFETINPREWSLEDQIRMFDQADVVVGAFGAAQTNIMFGTDMNVVSLYPVGWVSGVRFSVAQGFGHDWTAIFSEPIPGETNKSDVRSRDILVDVDTLENKITEIV